MKHIYLFIVVGFLFTNCGKEFLDIKREAHQVVPKELKDYQGILDREDVMYRTHLHLNMIGADEYETADQFIGTVPASHQWIVKAYTWQGNPYEISDNIISWDNTYERILYANMALEVARTDASQAEKDEVIGQALFHRAWNYYQLVTMFCEAYQPGQSEIMLGLPLRKDYNITARLERSSLEETYRFIEQDLLKAERLIKRMAINKFRADTFSVKALLAKLYLEMEDYERSLEYSLLYLAENNELLDYNQITDFDNRYSFSDYFYGENNPEVLLHFWNTTVPIIANSRYDLLETLLPLYDQYDLRRKLFFYTEADGRITFKGSYYGSLAYFTGIATDEMYLLAAECYARGGDKIWPASYLNDLLKNRYEKGKFVELDFTDWSEEQILKRLILERQKELCWRGTRWVDLKRYNKEKRFQTTLKRTMLGQEYILKPNDPRWVWPIPPNEVLHAGQAQNQR